MRADSGHDCGSPVTFRFRDLGPVKDAALQLGRLTVIAGRNNTGKTYITYSLYGFLKMWRRVAVPRSLGLIQNGAIRDAADMLRKTGRAAIPFPSSAIGDQRKALLRELEAGFSRGLPGVFSSRGDSFRGSRFSVGIEGGAADLPPSPMEADINGNGISVEHDGTDLILELDGSARPRHGERLARQVARIYSRFLLHDLFPDPFILSAERFGISLFYRELDFTKNQLVDMLQKLGDEGSRKFVSPFLLIDRTTSRYALPIKDNIDFTRSIPDMPSQVSGLAEDKLHDDVKDIIEGYYGNATEDIRFISKARGKGRSFNIPLHLASSSARGLADLYFYLRHVAERGQLLIVDEPESHLDTRNQVLFARMLARFAAAGLHVLVTTHSDYLVKEINNLIMLDRDFAEKDAVSRKLGYRNGESLDPRLVRAYVCENGGLTECEIGPFGIEMPVFDEIIDSINRAAIELASRASTDSGEGRETC